MAKLGASECARERHDNHEIIITIVYELRRPIPGGGRWGAGPQHTKARQREQVRLGFEWNVGLRFDVDPDDLAAEDLAPKGQALAF